jgi:hypothetical protein
MFRIKKTGIVDVVIVYSTRPRGCAWKVRVRAVGFKQGTWVDGDSPPWARHRSSKLLGFSFSTRGYAQVLLIICVVEQNKKRALCVQVKNKPCVIYTAFMKRNHTMWVSSLVETVQMMYCISLLMWYCTHCTLAGKTIFMYIFVYNCKQWTFS